MSESGINQRIEPPPRANPLHLHDRAGSGIISKKDPSNVIRGDDNRGSLLPSPLEEIPPFVPPYVPGPPEEGQTEPPLPPDPGGGTGGFPFVYWGGRWWAAVQYDRETGEILEDPYWYPFAPDDCCDEGEGMQSPDAPVSLIFEE